MKDNRDAFLTKHFINGSWREGRGNRTVEVRDPYRRELITTYQAAGLLDVADAYECAEAAHPSWVQVSFAERRAIMERAWQWVETNHCEIVNHLIRESGSTRRKAAFEIHLALEFLRAAAELTTQPVGKILVSPDPAKENRLYYQPVGVVGVISPFNLPFFLSLKPVIAALALGNTVVLKSHELTPVTGGTLIARMFDECGLPPGVLNVIVTDIDEIGDYFIEHPVPQVIAFTGSSTTGRHVAEVCGRHLKKVVLELGGNSALIVLDDADLELAVNAASFSRFTHAGQACLSANRLVVADRIYDAFLDRYVEKAAALAVGDPNEASTVIGPLISPRQAELLQLQVDEAVRKGAKMALAAKERPADSSLCTPVVLSEVTVDNPVSQVELFGPVTCLMRAADDTDAIRIANTTPYGLSGAVHSTNLDRAIRIARQVRTGMIHVNNTTIADEAAVPFGGIGASGNGRLNGESSLEAFTRPVWISVHHGTPKFPF